MPVDVNNPTKMTDALRSKVNEFNSAFKLGIDLGTKTGGIALVKNNKVILARTFLDYHNTDVKKRRAHRRNRRSRRAKEKRLARLRSWVLRQKVNGKQLPDPYKIRNIPFHRAGEKPSNIKGKANWVSAVIDGKNTSEEAFVKALVTIFMKRGQSYDKFEIEGLNDKEFLEFLNERTAVSQEEHDELLAEFEARYNNGGYSISEYEKAREHVSKMQKNPDEKNRKYREGEIKRLVNAFCNRAGINEGDKWASDLVHILNRRVRKARFKNRILIRCNICDKPTPNKGNMEVRKLSYLDAVRNFLKSGRIDESPEIERYYLDLYNNSQSIRSKILDQTPLSASEKFEKRKFISKILPKTYCSDNPFILEKQKDVKKQIVDLLFNKLYGRSRYCKNHLGIKAEGKDVEEGRHGQIGKRHDRNVALMNHDKRVLNLLEKLLFNYDDKLTQQIKTSGIKYVSIEAPEPKTKKTKKGKTTERDPRKLKEKLFDACGGVCIYTGNMLDRMKMGEYEADHIFPESRDGPSVQDNLILTTHAINKNKNNMTPWEWLHGDDAKWQVFSDRCNEFYKKGRLTKRKLELLLNKSGEYPENNPTELAKVGARIGNFQTELIELFNKYGIESPQTLFMKGKPIIQVVRGNETQKLRRLWGTSNPGFVPPLKDRTTMFNHAEDAAIAASMPPKIWREQIYRYTSKFQDGKERPDFAIPDIAPHWGEYVENRKSPLLAVLGKTNYTWKTSIVDDTFYKKYNANSKFDKIYKQPGSNKTGPVKDDRPILLEGKHELDIKKKYYHKVVDGSRYFLESQPGGTLVEIQPKDGPKRYIQISPVFDEVILTGDAILRTPIRPLLELYASGKLDLESINNKHLKEAFKSQNDYMRNYKNAVHIRLHDIIWLGKTNTHKEGYFIITKLGQSIKMRPEEKEKTNKDIYKKIVDLSSIKIDNVSPVVKMSDLTLTKGDITFLTSSKSSSQT